MVYATMYFKMCIYCAFVVMLPTLTLSGIYKCPSLHICMQILLMWPVRSLITKTAWQGAQTTIYCAVSEEMDGVSGQYLSDCKIKKLTNLQATDDSIAERLWAVSMQMVGLEEEQ